MKQAIQIGDNVTDIFRLPCIDSVHKDFVYVPEPHMTELYRLRINVFDLQHAKSPTFEGEKGDWLCETDDGKWMCLTNEEYHSYIGDEENV